jgi:hypothetical protein
MGYFTNKDNDNLMMSNYIYDNIINRIDKNNNILDIFIHSFDKKSELNINTKYPNTTKTIIEEQINFVENLSNKNKEYYNKLNEFNYDKNTSYNIQSVLSMQYSRSYVIKMALNYSTINNFEYDVIIRVRFDIGIRMKHSLNGYKPDNLVFDPDKYDYNYFYSSYWNQLNAGYCDFWEFSNSKNMKIFSEIYNYLTSNMFVLNSEYIIAVTNNWYHSNEDNEFSNEMLNKHTNVKCYKYNFIHTINCHLIEKFFMIKCNLYEKTAFLDFTCGATSIGL